MRENTGALGELRFAEGSGTAVGALLDDHGIAAVAVGPDDRVRWFNGVVRAILNRPATLGDDDLQAAVRQALRLPPRLLEGLQPGEHRTGEVRFSAVHALLGVTASVRGIADAGEVVALVTFPASPVRESEDEQVRRLQVMLRSTSDIIVVIDVEGTVLYSNEAAGRMTGLAGTDTNGSSIFDFIHPGDLDVATDAFLRGVVAGERVDPVEVRLRRVDGSWLNVEARIEDHVADDAVGGYVITVTDITDRIRRQEEAATHQRRLESVVENIDDVIVILDPSLAVSWASPGIERLVDAPAYTNVGENAFNDMHPDDIEGVLTVIHSVMHTPEGRGRVELRLRHRRLGWRWVEAAVVNRLEDPAVEGLVCTLRDITDQRTANTELRRLNEAERASASQLREMDRLKDQFLATVSHELRTPLTAVRGFSELLVQRSGKLDRATQNHLAARIHSNAREMEDMIEQLLDFSRLQAGRVDVHTEPLAVAGVVESTLERLDHHLSQHDVQVSVGDIRVLADRRAIDHVLRNLLTNAARYSVPGSTIEIGAERRDGEAWITVRDHGIGIPEEEHGRIFQSFYQASPGSPGRRGTGVGLNIARRYAQLQSGRLWLDSVPDRGSTFYLALPSAD